MELKCKGEGCDSKYIQNKKKQLCSECVFKLNHKGKSRQEVYSEKSKLNKISNIKNLKNLEDLENPKTLDMIDKMELQDMFLKNIQNQNKAEQEAKEEINFQKRFKNSKLFRTGDNKKGRKPLIKKTKKQSEIDLRYKLVCIEMDYIEEKVCTGCLRYQGGDVRLSHSHIISREDCKRIGKPELIYDRDNITYHCMSFGENEGCHQLHENPTKRHLLADYPMNFNYIKRVAPELVEKYSIKK